MNIWNHFRKTISNERGWWPILGAIAKGVGAAASKAIALAGKGAMAAKSAAIGLGKGISGTQVGGAAAAKGYAATAGSVAKGMGMGALKGNALGSAAAYQGLNAGALGAGQMAGQGLKALALNQIQGGQSNPIAAVTNSFDSVETPNQSPRSSLGSALMERVGAMMKNPLQSNNPTPNQPQDISPQERLPEEQIQAGQMQAPMVTMSSPLAANDPELQRQLEIRRRMMYA